MHTRLSTLFSLVQRISADDALKHKWFSEVPLPKSKDFMPTFPALNELDRYFFNHLLSLWSNATLFYFINAKLISIYNLKLHRRTKRYLKSPDPLEEQRLKELQGNIGNRGLFG